MSSAKSFAKRKLFYSVIRMFFGSFLIYMAYSETGIWTTIVLFLLLLWAEDSAWTGYSLSVLIKRVSLLEKGRQQDNCLGGVE